jgi:hypothetical protein
MALSDYLDLYAPHIDLGTLSFWESGCWDWKIIFPNAQRYVPDIYQQILEIQSDILPQNHLEFYSDNEESFWVCI